MKSIHDWNQTALVIVDPQVDMLAADGGAADLFFGQVEKRGVVANLRRLRDAADAAGIPVFYSRVEITEADWSGWQPRNGLQALFLERRLMSKGAGAEFLPELAPNERTILLEPRKGPSSVQSDAADQFRARGVDTIIVAGMVANLCVESQVRDAVDDGFNAIVVQDAMATMSDEAHDSAVANFGLLATEVVTTEDVVGNLSALAN